MVLDARLDPLGAAAIAPGLAVALALLVEEGFESMREQLVRGVASAENESANRAPGHLEQKEAIDMLGC